MNFVLVFLIMKGADWLQGPYVYALYQHCTFASLAALCLSPSLRHLFAPRCVDGFGIGAIGQLFIVGFGASLLFGTIVGSAADT
jgi:hypothetical protein